MQRGRTTGAGAVRPDAARARRGRCRAVGGPWPEGEQYDATLLAEGDRRNVVDRYRYWTMAGDRRRPRRPPARLPRRDRELAARLQHRHDRPLRERVPRPRGAHRRQPALEPAGRDGHRPLPARRPPRGRAVARGAPARPAGRAGRPVGHRQPARLAAPRDHRGAAPGVLPVRPGGPRACPGRPARPATRRSRSRSSGRRGPSTPRPPPRSRCTRGCAPMRTCPATTPGAG